MAYLSSLFLFFLFNCVNVNPYNFKTCSQYLIQLNQAFKILMVGENVYCNKSMDFGNRNQSFMYTKCLLFR